jgi:argininosuccinate lyase
LADDLFIWSTMEFDMVELHDRYCGTSSIMLQKKNPTGSRISRALPRNRSAL